MGSVYLTFRTNTRDSTRSMKPWPEWKIRSVETGSMSDLERIRKRDLYFIRFNKIKFPKSSIKIKPSLSPSIKLLESSVKLKNYFPIILIWSRRLIYWIHCTVLLSYTCCFMLKYYTGVVWCLINTTIPSAKFFFLFFYIYWYVQSTNKIFIST